MALKDSNIYSTCVGIVHYLGTSVTEPCDYQETDTTESPASPVVSPEAKQSRDKTNWQNPCEPSRLGRMLITEITELADKKAKRQIPVNSRHVLARSINNSLRGMDHYKGQLLYGWDHLFDLTAGH